jgi:hypothetical protein
MTCHDAFHSPNNTIANNKNQARSRIYSTRANETNYQTQGNEFLQYGTIYRDSLRIRPGSLAINVIATDFIETIRAFRSVLERLLNQPPVAQRYCPVHACGQIRVVGGDQGGQAVVSDDGQKFGEHGLGGGDIQVAGWFVGQQ